VVPGLRPPAGRHRGQRALGESGFARTDLDQQLRQHWIEHIILAGLTAPGCAEHLRAAVELNGPIYAEHVLATADVVAALKS
jgi:nicotinamidase-related amidase